ncbi:hypothetical protein HDE_04057 [Halotydeus destructor]|nr:hypothetical protein HDE_04057 [Halotydeus destructor]
MIMIVINCLATLIALFAGPSTGMNSQSSWVNNNNNNNNYNNNNNNNNNFQSSQSSQSSYSSSSNSGPGGSSNYVQTGNGRAQVYVAYNKGSLYNFSNGGSVSTNSNGNTLQVSSNEYGTVTATIDGQSQLVIESGPDGLYERPLNAEDEAKINEYQRQQDEMWAEFHRSMASMNQPMQPMQPMAPMVFPPMRF